MAFPLYRKNASIKKLSLISNSTASQSGWQTITMHILSNISRSKGNQAITFGQLVEYDMRHIFPETYKICTEETSPRHLPKKSKLSISLDQQHKVLKSLFPLYTNLRALE